MRLSPSPRSRVIFVALIFTACLSLSYPQTNGRKVALVIGNGSYAKIQALSNPANDAQDVAAALSRIGFLVFTNGDVGRRAMRGLIDDFGLAIKSADIALFYYSGHGVQLDGENYLVPIDAEVSTPGDVPDECVSLSRITSRMSEAGAGANVIILDACRDNPFRAVSRGIDRGLAVVAQKPSESIIVYATSENAKAEDGSGRNGTFTEALVHNIERKDSLADLLLDVKAKVRASTMDKQKPAVYENLTHKIYLAGMPEAIAPNVPADNVPVAKLSLTRSFGALVVSATTGGELFLDGKSIGSLPARTEARLDIIESGERVLELRYGDGEKEAKIVDVKAGQQASLSFSYLRKPLPPAPMEKLGDLVRVKGGKFRMGSSDGQLEARPDHEVSLQDFYIGQYEVTQAEYSSVMRKNPSEFKGGDLPVEHVDWIDAIAYCNALSAKERLRPVYAISGGKVSADFSKNGYRLPTEAEWEYAARGGERGIREGAEYSGSDDPGDVAWFSGNSEGKTHPVGAKAPNALGLYDMSGNAWEWCWDWWGKYPKDLQPDPVGGPPSGDHVIRGGCFYSGETQLRPYYRAIRLFHYSYLSVGFRVLRRP